MGSSGESQRLVGLDLLRVALIALLICHHVACAIGDVGAWYYILPPPEGGVTRLLFTIFVAVNQSFFMSLFFFVSGYFTAPAYDRKGTAAFLRDRRIRLGVPLLVYFFVLNPQVEFLGQLFSGPQLLEPVFDQDELGDVQRVPRSPLIGLPVTASWSVTRQRIRSDSISRYATRGFAAKSTMPAPAS